MVLRRVRHAGVTLMLAGTLIAPKAAQAEKEGAIAVRYRAPSVCPDQRAFEGELDQRLGDAPRPSTVLDVDLSVLVARGTPPLDELFVGKLLRDGRPVRTIEGDTCAEVVKALALVAALGILPPERGGDASLTPPPPAGSAESPGAVGESVPRGLVAKRASAAPSARSSGSIVVGAGGFVDSYTAAGANLGGSLFVEVGVPSDTPLFAPRLRLSFGATLASETDTPSDSRPSGTISTSFSRQFAGVSACPIGFPLAAPASGDLVIRPCAALALDRIQGKTTGISTPRDAAALFATGHVFPRLEWAWGGSPRSRRVVVGAQAGVAVPFAPPRFIVEDPVNTVYQVPRAGFVGQVDLGVRVF